MVDSLSHTLPFPPFSVDWVDAHNLVITGGGGASKTGVPNGVLLYMVRGGVERLVQRRFYQTGDELPYFSKALPALDLLAIAVGNRVQLLRLHNLKPLGKPVLELAPNPNVMDPTMVIAFFAPPAGAGATGAGGVVSGAGGSSSGSSSSSGGGKHYMAVGAHDGHIRVLELIIGQASLQQQQLGSSSSSSSNSSSISADEPVVANVGVSPTATDKPFRDLAFHPSGRLVLGSCEDGTWRAFWVGGGQQQQQQEQQQQEQQQQQQQQQQMELTPAFTLFATINGGMLGGLETTAAAVGKDQGLGQGGLYYTSRCGKFSEDGKFLFTVHYVRRGPKNADKRPVLTKWSIDLPSEGGQVTAKVLKTVRLGGVDPIMCIDLRGGVGVAGDCSGRTIIFQTSNLWWKSREKMHNFGVTSLSFYPPLPRSFGPSLSKVEEEDVRIASTSGDKTLRLQYLHPSRGRNSGSSSSSSSSSKRGCIAWFFLFWLRLLLLLLLLGGVLVALSVFNDVPPLRVIDHFLGGIYEEPVWARMKEVAEEGWRKGLFKLGVSEQVKIRMEEGVREGWREGMVLVGRVGGWVKEEVLPVVIPIVVKAKERVVPVVIEAKEAVDGWRGEL